MVFDLIITNMACSFIYITDTKMPAFLGASVAVSIAVEDKSPLAYDASSKGKTDPLPTLDNELNASSADATAFTNMEFDDATTLLVEEVELVVDSGSDDDISDLRTDSHEFLVPITCPFVSNIFNAVRPCVQTPYSSIATSTDPMPMMSTPIASSHVAGSQLLNTPEVKARTSPLTGGSVLQPRVPHVTPSVFSAGLAVQSVASLMQLEKDMATAAQRLTGKLIIRRFLSITHLILVST